MKDSNYKIGLAGCGKMGTAMVWAWLSADLVERIDILDPHGLPPELENDKIKLRTDAAPDWDLLFLAIKPQDVAAFGASIKLPPDLAVVSIAAGKSLASLQSAFGSRPFVRAMPNTPASIGMGMTVACANDLANTKHKHRAETLLSALGAFEWTKDESILDTVTALSGSGPAYVFYLIETMAQAGIKSGLDPDLAMKLARQTVIGAAALADHQDIPVSKLRENVTSPNGTTAAALSVLMDGKFQDIMTEAIAKATARSRELSK